MWKPVTLSLMALLLSACGANKESDEAAGDDATEAGEPFPAETQNLLAQGLRSAGSSVEFDPDVGRCEVIYLIFRDVAANSNPPPTGRISQENAEAAASANGSLFLSVRNLTDDSVALQAVQDCVPYLVGKPF